MNKTLYNTQTVFGLTAAAILTAAIGCGEFGGGSVVVPKVTILPAELSGAADTTASSGAVETPGVKATGAGPGTFSGRVILTGTAPGLPALFVKGADIKDKEICAANDVPDERLVLGAENGVANVFVFMKKAPKGTPKLSPTEPLIFDQKACQFIPHCMIVPVGATVKVLSDDATAHNTHTNPAKNNGVSSLVPANDREGVLKLEYTRAEDPFSVTCDFHSWMKAYHLPLDHPFGAVTDADGRFEIKDIPSGTHDFVVWHESASGQYVERKLKVKIVAGETVTQDIEYSADKLSL